MPNFNIFNLDFRKEDERSQIYKILKNKLEQYFNLLVSDDSPEKKEKTKHLYNAETHVYIIHELFEIFLPIEKWSGKLKELSHDSLIPWPGGTTYFYSMDTVLPPNIPSGWLHFGYAFLDDKFVKTAFYGLQTIVDFQLCPQGVAVDPIAINHGIKPSFYIGVTINKKNIENFLLTKKGNPLETFVNEENKRKHEERIRDSEREFYHTQMTYEPGWFSDELMKLAVERDWYIPPSPHNDELRKSYERAKERRKFESGTGIADKE